MGHVAGDSVPRLGTAIHNKFRLERVHERASYTPPRQRRPNIDRACADANNRDGVKVEAVGAKGYWVVMQEPEGKRVPAYVRCHRERLPTEAARFDLLSWWLGSQMSAHSIPYAGPA